MARENSRVGSTGENRNLERVGDVAGTFSNTGGYMGVDGINNLIQEKNYPSYIDNLRRMVQQQNQLGPDEFGSYVIPPSDPTYSTGQQYARSIAGGMPMSQVIAPGVSYSPEQPGGYTQADLNIAAGMTPPAPVYKEPDDPSFLGTGIGGVTIPGGRRDKMPPLRKDLPVYQEPDLSGFARIEDLPTFNPDELKKDIMMSLPTYEQQDLSGFARIEDLPTFNPDELKQDILMSLPEQQMQDLSGFMTQADINKAISGINMPTYEQPDLSAYDTRIAELEQSLAALQQPTGGRFSVNQPQVRGLF